jgi:hypothetical protein
MVLLTVLTAVLPDRDRPRDPRDRAAGAAARLCGIVHAMSMA